MKTMKTIAAALITAVTLNGAAFVTAASAAQPKKMSMAIIGANSKTCTAKLQIIIVAESAGMVPVWLQKQGGPAVGPIWVEAKTTPKGKHIGRLNHNVPVVGPHDEKYRAISGPVNSNWAPYKSKNC